MARPKKKINLTKNGRTILEKRYLKKTKTGKPLESPENLFNRVATFIASADKKYGATDADVVKTKKKFYEMMARLDFLPNSPCIAGAGRENANLFACFVLPVHDSIQSIFETAAIAACVQKGGGGVGYDFSELRPSGSKVRTSTGISSGAVSFMTVFDVITDVIKQGSFRRGAQLGAMNVSHPDIDVFIDSKSNGSKVLSNFNLSVKITDSFVKSVQNDKKYKMYNPHTKKTYLSAQKSTELFNKIAKNAWSNGDPGILFIDTINEYNPLPGLGRIEATNPCGELPTHPFSACVLGSVNLYNHIAKGAVDYEKLEKTVKGAVHFLDNVIDVNVYPHEKIGEMVNGNRQIGLGIMGFADLLFEIGIPYNTPEARKIGEEIMKFVAKIAAITSKKMAESRGEFSNTEKSVWTDKRRNATLTSIAPTGTIGLIAGVHGGGIEPVFALAYKRKIAEGDVLVEVNPILERKLKEKKIYSDKLIDKIIEAGSVQHIDEIPEDIKKIFVTSHDIHWKDHIKMQSAFQKHVHTGVSKTINMPSDATVEDVKQAYLMAHKMGCKGITVYRDKSRDEQVLSIDKSREKPTERPKVLSGRTEKFKTATCGTLFTTLSEQDDKLFEVFCRMGKGGTCLDSWTETTGRLISLALRSGVKPQEIVKQLEQIRCSETTFDEEGKIYSCSDAIAKSIKRYLKEEKNIEVPKAIEAGNNQCKQCGGDLVMESGCANCPSCGFSKCG